MVPELRELLNDNDPSVRAEALVALKNLAGKGAPPAELKSLAPTADPQRRPPMKVDFETSERKATENGREIVSARP